MVKPMAEPTGMGDIEDGQGRIARDAGEEVRDPARTHRDEGGLADADDHPDGKQLRKILGERGAGGGEAPYHDPGQHEPFARIAVAQKTEERCGDEIAEHEGRCGPAAPGVAEMQVVLERRQHRGEDVAVEVVEEIQRREQRQGHPGGTKRGAGGHAAATLRNPGGRGKEPAAFPRSQVVLGDEEDRVIVAGARPVAGIGPIPERAQRAECLPASLPNRSAAAAAPASSRCRLPSEPSALTCSV